MFYIAALAHTKRMAALLSQLPGPIQDSLKHVLDSCVCPYKANHSTPQAASWVHTGQLAV
jgi:hypothetical protein